MVFAKAMWTLLLLASFVDGAIAEQKLTASDAAGGDRFGWSVSVSGDYAVVGAVRDNSQAGSAYTVSYTHLTLPTNREV